MESCLNVIPVTAFIVSSCICVALMLYNWAATWENRIFAYAKTKPQISCAVTAQLISAFVFVTWIVQSLYYLNPKFRASSYLLWLHSLVCVGPVRKPRRPVFWRRGSYSTGCMDGPFYCETILFSQKKKKKKKKKIVALKMTENSHLCPNIILVSIPLRWHAIYQTRHVNNTYLRLIDVMSILSSIAN